jgi:hypothetical protein
MARPTNGDTDSLTVNLNQNLLERLSRHCFRTELTKSQVVSMALKRFLAAELAMDPAFWDTLYDKVDNEGKLSKL